MDVSPHECLIKINSILPITGNLLFYVVERAEYSLLIPVIEYNPV